MAIHACWFSVGADTVERFSRNKRDELPKDVSETIDESPCKKKKKNDRVSLLFIRGDRQFWIWICGKFFIFFFCIPDGEPKLPCTTVINFLPVPCENDFGLNSCRLETDNTTDSMAFNETVVLPVVYSVWKLWFSYRVCSAKLLIHLGIRS